MEERRLNVILAKAGGNSGKGSLNAKISLPKKWVDEMGITLEDKKVIVSFDGKEIVIKKG